MEKNKRVAVVTGAARGIGAAVARVLALQNRIVVITDISANGEKTAREMREAGLQVHFEQLNVADAPNVKAIIKKVLAEFGRIDILVNNAGIRPTQPFSQMSLDDWQKVLQVNLEGIFNLCSAILPVMKENAWGRIINLSSLAAQQGSTGGHSHYAASKAGVIGLTKSLAREYAAFGITVNAVSPGWIDTEGWGGALDGKRDEFAAKVPVGRLGTPEDVAYCINFLASDEASYLTGINLPINGGLYIS
jgi:NAD(P)-dependent dehydrogenase (short-subunit alcohol dehydrogenase family)